MNTSSQIRATSGQLVVLSIRRPSWARFQFYSSQLTPKGGHGPHSRHCLHCPLKHGPAFREQKLVYEERAWATRAKLDALLALHLYIQQVQNAVGVRQGATGAVRAVGWGGIWRGLVEGRLDWTGLFSNVLLNHTSFARAYYYYTDSWNKRLRQEYDKNCRSSPSLLGPMCIIWLAVFSWVIEWRLVFKQGPRKAVAYFIGYEEEPTQNVKVVIEFWYLSLRRDWPINHLKTHQDDLLSIIINAVTGKINFISFFHSIYLARFWLNALWKNPSTRFCAQARLDNIVSLFFPTNAKYEMWIQSLFNKDSGGTHVEGKQNIVASFLLIYFSVLWRWKRVITSEN